MTAPTARCMMWAWSSMCALCSMQQLPCLRSPMLTSAIVTTQTSTTAAAATSLPACQYPTYQVSFQLVSCTFGLSFCSVFVCVSSVCKTLQKHSCLYCHSHQHCKCLVAKQQAWNITMHQLQCILPSLLSGMHSHVMYCSFSVS